MNPLMDNIIEPSDDFDFSYLSLANPTGIQGGSYFTKIECNSKSLYIQTPKSLTKQGFVKSGKKIVVDLMFSNNDEKFIRWLENLEIRCQQMIFEKGDSWFQSSLELNDIETAFTSPLKVYKSGKYYLLRVNVKMNYTTNAPVIKIYNEDESPLTINDINSNTNIISILEIQGIKFTSRSFQIEIELKQSMILNTEVLFENCLIKPASKKLKEKHDPLVFKMMKENEEKISKSSNKDNVENSKDESLEIISSDYFNKLEEVNDLDDRLDDRLDEKYDSSVDEEKETNELENVDLNIEELDNTEEVIHNEDLKEFDLTSSLSSLETFKIKKPNQVYNEIYKAARQKAKKAKKQAILAFLEAKNIKKTYMLEDIEDSDDSDMDIENMNL
jgi:hypothetical protein